MIKFLEYFQLLEGISSYVESFIPKFLQLSPSTYGFKSSINNLPTSRPYGFWIDKHGNFVPVGPYRHAPFGYKCIEQYNNTVTPGTGIPIYEKDHDNILDFLFKAGWVRVLIKTNIIYTSGKFKTNAQSKIVNIMKEMYDLPEENWWTYK